MTTSSLFTLLAILFFLAASIYAFIKRSPVAGLVCAGIVCLVLANTNLIAD